MRNLHPTPWSPAPSCRDACGRSTKTLTTMLPWCVARLHPRGLHSIRRRRSWRRKHILHQRLHLLLNLPSPSFTLGGRPRLHLPLNLAQIVAIHPREREWATNRFRIPRDVVKQAPVQTNFGCVPPLQALVHKPLTTKIIQPLRALVHKFLTPSILSSVCNGVPMRRPYLLLGANAQIASMVKHPEHTLQPRVRNMPCVCMRNTAVE